MKAARTMLVVGTLLLAGALFAADIAVDNDTTVDFSKFRSFAWKLDAQAPNPATRQRVTGSVEKELLARGLKKVEQAPDLWVSYQVFLKREATSTDWDYGKFKFQGRNVTVEKLSRGSLTVDLVDAKSGKLVWRAVATDYVPPDAPAPEGVIEKAVALMFKGFPPKKD